jgi:hypothetical protein
MLEFRAEDCGMNLTNDTYVILISTKTAMERYYRDKSGWVKVSVRGRRFRATAEQVLNHLLPALAGIKPNIALKVEHHDKPVWMDAPEPLEPGIPS